MKVIETRYLFDVRQDGVVCSIRKIDTIEHNSYNTILEEFELIRREIEEYVEEALGIYIGQSITGK